jgi:tetratricopeptide (TPR) repeat protein
MTEAAQGMHWAELRTAFLWAVAALVLFLGGIFAYATAGAAFVDRLDEQIGEVQLERAVALERAGLLAQAEQQYEAALAATFAGRQNRAFALKQLGSLRLDQGRFEEAIGPLRASVASGQPPISVYKPYVEALLASNALEEAAAAAVDWRTLAEERGNRLELSRAHYYLGHLALARGEEGAAAAHFAQGHAVLPGRHNALALARLALAAAAYPEAWAHVQDVFLTGPEPAMWREALELKRRVLEHYVP